MGPIGARLARTRVGVALTLVRRKVLQGAERSQASAGTSIGEAVGVGEAVAVAAWGRQGMVFEVPRQRLFAALIERQHQRGRAGWFRF